MMRPEIPTQRPICAACDNPCGPVTYTVERRPARDDDGPTVLCSAICVGEYAEAEEWLDHQRLRAHVEALALQRGVVR